MIDKILVFLTMAVTGGVAVESIDFEELVDSTTKVVARQNQGTVARVNQCARAFGVELDFSSPEAWARSAIENGLLSETVIPLEFGEHARKTNLDIKVDSGRR